MSILERHWNLRRDPFDARRSTYVPLACHDEAVARLVHAIETAGRSARLIAPAGLGKSRVLSRALEATRSPERRVARISGPTDGAELFAWLAVELGARLAPGSSRSVGWRSLADCVRLCRWQGLQVVLVVDDCHWLTAQGDRIDLERLNQVDPDPSARLTVIRLGRPLDIDSPGHERTTPVNDWSLSIRLDPLTRSETAAYLEAKLGAAGRSEPTFTPRAIARIHAASLGVPLGIDRIASLALLASALRGHEMVTPELIDEATLEYPSIEMTLVEG
jgi:type II secretory pathway predicted ATPase ExeA